MSGRELLLELAKTRPTLPVLLMSGYHEEILHSDMRCLTKPFDVDALYQAVADLLGARPRAAAV
jgi:DNA-binding NtrC family response regulator